MLYDCYNEISIGGKMVSKLYFEMDGIEPSFVIRAEDPGLFSPAKGQEGFVLLGLPFEVARSSVGPAEAIIDAGIVMSRTEFDRWMEGGWPYTDELNVSVFKGVGLRYSESVKAEKQK